MQTKKDDPLIVVAETIETPNSEEYKQDEPPRVKKRI